ncbi:cation:proton antiporter [Candidatus Nitronereus thalassa]|uniref:Cation:proton antiporter n=1 Tax=Candidatus Nitronereus thalassa TaxID=3020898 RepID=A0ABU3K8A9_9BACT|nr:cation:proton antiporter [Candidatus Nitronereus thalassa]MDT7042602.1 cation:proton antiporter [Candidatus Nitronereus thalassa]
MEDISVLRDIVVIFAVSIGVVFLFQKVHLPPIAGFLVAGTVVGPYGLNLISDREQVQVLAEVGVILLLFTIGLEFSLAKLKSSRSLFLIAGPAQVFGVLVLIMGGGLVFGLSVKAAIFWGMLLSLSSTAIVLRALAERKENDTLHGRSTIGILIFQDLAVVPMMLMTPFLSDISDKGADGMGQILLTLLESLVLVVGVVIAARVLVPRFLEHIVRTRSRELFLLTVIVLGLGTAWLTSLVGLSLALGAFIAGLLISESEYSHQALAEVLPFRDSFNSLFFVSIGMLMDPRVLLDHPLLIVTMVATVFIGKFVTGAGAALAAGVPVRSAVLAGVALAQVGEFAFILAQEGLKVGILYRDTYNVFLAVSVLTMIITPIVIQWSPKIARRAEALQRLHQWFPGRTSFRTDLSQLKLKEHVVIVGYGLNGRNLSKVLSEFQIPYVVLEIRGEVIQMELGAGVPFQYGDATNPTVLRHVQIEQAKVFVVATSDPFGARRMVQLARELNPSLHIVVRTRYLKELEELQKLGANEIIPEEFETSIEISSLVLQSFNLPSQTIREKAEQIRREGYALLRRGELPELAHHLGTGTLGDVEVETCRIDDNSPALGKSLEELSIHQRTGVSVVALLRAGVTQSNPSNKSVLEVGDVLALLGPAENIRRAISLLVDPKHE